MAVTVYRIFDCTDIVKNKNAANGAPADSPIEVDTLIVVQQHCGRSEGAD